MINYNTVFHFYCLFFPLVLTNTEPAVLGSECHGHDRVLNLGAIGIYIYADNEHYAHPIRTLDGTA